MLINLRNALMSGKRLPYDAEVEYLEGTGTQWINTEVASFNWPYLEITCKVNSIYTSTYTYGMIGNSNGASRWQGIAPNGGSGVLFRGYDNPTTISESATSDFITLIFDGPNRMAYAGQSSATLLSGRATGATYGVWAYVGRVNPIAMSVASVKIGTSRDNLLFDGIPVRRGTVGYLYDRVSRRLFGNAGTGDFVLGQDVVPVEWLESHGTEYIDTGYVPNMNSVFDVTFSPNNVDFVGHPVHGNAYGATNKYTSSAICPLTLWTGNNYNNRFFYAPVAMNGLVVGQKYHIVQSAASLSRDGVVVGNYDSSQMRTPLVEPMWLFAYMDTQTERLYGLLRMYSWNVSELGISMRSMLPVRVGTEGAMMDALTRRIYRNAGTGAFTYGNDLKYPIPAS